MMPDEIQNNPMGISSCIEDCNLPYCDDGCSANDCPPNCIPICDGKDFCDDTGICQSIGCTTTCLETSPVCLDGSCPYVALDGEQSGAYVYQNVANDVPLHCQWEAPGQPCNVSVSTPNALGKHVLQDHLEPQTVLTCPLDECDQVMDYLKLPDHLLFEHNPDRYICLWQHCGLTFLTHEALDTHIKLSHANLDCHWAGCEVSAKNLSQMKNHIDMHHLGFDFASNVSTSPAQPEASTERSHCERVDSRPHVSIPPRTDHFSTPEAPDTLPPMLQKYVLPIIGIQKQNSVHTSPASTNVTPSSFISDPPENSNPLPLSSFKNSFRSSPTKTKTVYTCEWLLDTSSSQICGMQYQNPFDLQTHMDRDHLWTTHLRSKTPQVISCNWQNCKRNGKTFQNKDKLRRHLFIHTGCEYSIDSSLVTFIRLSTLEQH